MDKELNPLEKSCNKGLNRIEISGSNSIEKGVSEVSFYKTTSKQGSELYLVSKSKERNSNKLYEEDDAIGTAVAFTISGIGAVAGAWFAYKQQYSVPVLPEIVSGLVGAVIGLSVGIVFGNDED